MGDKTTVKVDKKLVKKAHEVGLNASKICENALEKAIEAIEGTSDKPNPKVENQHSRKGSSPIFAFLPNSSSIRISSLSLAIRSPPTTPVLIIGHPHPTAK